MNTVHDEIMRTLGFAPQAIKASGVTRFATTSRPSNRDGWVRIMRDGIIRFGCWRQGITGWWRDGAGDRQASKKDEQAEKQVLAEEENRLQRQARINQQLLACAHSLQRQSPVGQYLVHRGLGALSKSPQALRMAALPYFDDGTEAGHFPVMLGAVTSPEGVLVGLHRTYISKAGMKAPVPCPKKLSRTSGLLAGASIKLHEPSVINGKLTLGVAEGIETALACHLASGIPTWSCVSAPGVKSFQWPGGLQSLVVFADHDAHGVGQSAARELAGRAVAAGLECRVLIPEIVGNDWLDVYVPGGAAQ
jgi:putative DNA primase/helicase